MTEIWRSLFGRSDSNDENKPKQTSSGNHDQTGEIIREYSPVQMFFLLRLEDILRQRQEFMNMLPSDKDEYEWKSKLLRKAIYSIYCDCLEQKVGIDAKALFERDKIQSQESKLK